MCKVNKKSTIIHQLIKTIIKMDEMDGNKYLRDLQIHKYLKKKKIKIFS